MVKIDGLQAPAIPDLTKLWAEWDEPSPAGGIDGVQGEFCEISLTPPGNDLKKLKLAVFKDVVLYYLKGDVLRYKEMMEDLHSYRVEKFAIDHRLKRAKEGKDVANKKYKDGNPVQAMYTYAVAWGILLPYFPEHYLSQSECALFSNISAMAIMEAKNDDLSKEQKESLAQIGIDASEVCISSPEFATVGIMAKSCRRARELANLAGSRDVPKDTLRFFAEQEKKLQGLALGTMFSELSADKIAAPAQV